MALSIRVDEVTTDSTGRIYISLTEGEPPLPSSPGGVVFDFLSKEAIGQELRELEARIGSRGTLLMAISDLVNVLGDPNLNQLSRLKGREKTISIDAVPATSILG